MTDQGISRKLAVIVHADVAGSTALVHRDEALAHQRINAAFQRFSVIIQEYSGTVHEIRGDALVAGFARASDAVCAALLFQQSQTAHNAKLNDAIVPGVRIGIALGEEVFADDTVTGAGVVLAQRVEQLSAPGGVCVTSAIHEAIPQRMPFDQESLGEQDVKGFEEPVRVYRVALKPGELVPEAETSTPTQSPLQNRRLIVVFAVVAVVVIGGVVLWLQPWQPEEEPASVARMALPLPDKPSIAVLPFDNLSGDPEQDYFCDGMTNDIITDLSKFKDLFVIASNSTFSYKGKAVKVQQVAEELGVRYVLEGSIQRTGERLRINAHLIDAITGHHLWAERYDRNASDFFAIQEDILQTIVASLASQVKQAEIKRALGKDTDNLKAYDYYQRGRRAYLGFTKEANNQARELFEKAIELDPDYARAYAFLTWVHVNNSTGRYRWGKDPERSLDLALEVARKAIALDPDDYRSHWGLGFAYLHHREFDRAQAEYERALALNPNDAGLLAEMADFLVKIGNADQAVAQVKMAMRINPHHPEWYFWNLGWAQYFAGQYEEALTALNQMSNPPNGVRRTLAAVLVRLGRLEEARAVMAKFIATDIDMTLEEMKANQRYKHREYLDRWIDDLRAAGLPEKRPLILPDKPSIAVLPFTNMSDDPKQEYFVDGMTEDVTTDLSKIAGLFVIARNSAFSYKGKTVKPEQVARELGVRYIVEGSVRRAGDRMRINAQLIDATTGGHVWAERYDGDLQDVFDLQDRITRKIVTALAVEVTEGQQAATAKRGTNNVEAYDLFMKGWALYGTDTPQGFIGAIPYFERAVTLDPGYGRAYAALASVYYVGHRRNWRRSFQVLPNFPKYPDDEAAFISRAFENLDKSLRTPNPLAYVLESETLLHKPDHSEAIVAAERAIALDPNGPDGYVQLARVLTMVGRPGEALTLVEKAMRLNPHYPPSYLAVLGLAYFGLEDYERAASLTAQAIKLSPYLNPLPLIASLGYLGEKKKAAPVIENLRQRYNEHLPGYPATIRVLVHWRFPLFKHAADRERLSEGLRRAGLS